MIKAFINDHDMYAEYGLIMVHREIGVAIPNIYQQVIPGMNGKLDYTSFYGDLTYQNRTIKISFKRKVDNNTEALKMNLNQEFNGKEAKIIFSDDNSHYWKGRLIFNKNDCNKIIHELEIDIDAYPKRFKVADDSEVK